MMGVPLAIVDKEKVSNLVKKLFNAEDTGAEFELDVDAAAGGGFTVRLKIKARVSTTFAGALLAGRDITYMNATAHLAQPASPQPPAPVTTQQSAAPDAQTSGKKKRDK